MKGLKKQWLKSYQSLFGGQCNLQDGWLIEICFMVSLLLTSVLTGFVSCKLFGFVLDQYFDGVVQQLELMTAIQVSNLVRTLAYIFGTLLTALFTILFLNIWNWLLKKTKKAVGEV